MTIQSCLEIVEELTATPTSEDLLLRWLSEIEGRVEVELLGLSPSRVHPFGESTAKSTPLSAPFPFDRLYWLYLVAMLDYTAGDSDRYENTAALFNSAYGDYAKWLKRGGAA